MKRALWFVALLSALMLAGCASSDTTSQTTYNLGTGDLPYKPTTHLLHRAIVSNYYSSVLNVLDATQDRMTTYTFATGSQPTYLQSSSDGTLTFVNNVGAGTISSLNNLQESVKGTASLGGYTESFVTSTNNKVGFAAVPNYSNGTFRLPGAIVRFNPTDGSTDTQIQMPNVEWLGMDPAEKHLVAFANSDNLAYWVDTTSNDPNTGVPAYYPLTLTDSTGTAVTLSRPTSVFFSSDSSTAYVLSCGPECGGATAPTVTAIDLTSITTPTTASTGTALSAKVTKVWTVKGAQRGMLSSKTLYLVGSTGTTSVDSGGNTVLDGWFTTLDVSTTSSTPTAIAIGPGTKRIIRTIGSNFWIGASECGSASCITMVNGSTATPLAAPHGNATGITLCTNRNHVYTIQGGQFFFYDESGTPLSSTYSTDTKAQAYDVLYIN